ncbi:MAG: transglutaminase domain-containing protein [Spirochaeta sp.]|nr:transglutaminase domain-containing protein [Spirochaeta sp.]
MLVLAVVALWSARRDPVIEDIEPVTVDPGNAVTVVGRHFADSGRLEIDGIAIPQEHIRRWTDSMVIFSLDERARSGLLRVQTAFGSSNAVFITNTSDIPDPVDIPPLTIDDLQPGSAAVGTVVRVVGQGFGPRTGVSRLTLRGNGEQHILRGGDRWIVRWTDERIDLVLPPGIGPGSYALEIDAVPTGRTLDVVSPAGRSELGQIQRYTVRQELFAAGISGDARAVFPLPMGLPVQERAQLLRETAQAEPNPADDAVLYRFFPIADVQGTENSQAPVDPQTLDPDEPVTEEGTEPVLLDRIVRVDLSARRTVRFQVSDEIDSRQLLEPVFREGFQDLLVQTDLDDETVADLTALRQTSIDLSDDVVSIARGIHDAVVDRFEPDEGGAADAATALIEGVAAPSVYADVAAALARTAGLPARRHYGVLITDGGQSIPHRWVEFFIPQVGWLPADPALSDGAYGNAVRSVTAFYREGEESETDNSDGTPPVAFGALDNRRITLTIDGLPDVYAYPGGGRISPPRSYAPGRLHVEFPTVSVPAGTSTRWEVPVLSPQFN